MTADNEFVPFISGIGVEQLWAWAGASSVLPPASTSSKAPLLECRGLCNGLYPVPATLCFVDREPNDAQRQQLQQSIILTTPALAATLETSVLAVCDDPRAAFIGLVSELQSQGLLCPFTSLSPSRFPHIDGSAIVHARAEIEDNVIIGPGCVIGAGCVVKQGSVLMQDVVLRENCVVGCDGIARYVSLGGQVLRFPHVAGVIIEAGCEIGANCVIARGALTSTRIGRNSVIGNLSNIGHGVHLGEKTWMSVGCMMGGNCRVGDHVTMGLGVGVRDNLVLGDGVSIAMGSVVMRSIEPNTSVLGNPAKAVPGVVAGPRR